MGGSFYLDQKTVFLYTPARRSLNGVNFCGSGKASGEIPSRFLKVIRGWYVPI